MSCVTQDYEMDAYQTRYAKRAANHDKWKWLPGMAAQLENKILIRIISVRGMSASAICLGVEWAPSVPFNLEGAIPYLLDDLTEVYVTRFLQNHGLMF